MRTSSRCGYDPGDRPLNAEVRDRPLNGESEGDACDGERAADALHCPSIDSELFGRQAAGFFLKSLRSWRPCGRRRGKSWPVVRESRRIGALTRCAPCLAV